MLTEFSSVGHVQGMRFKVDNPGASSQRQRVLGFFEFSDGFLTSREFSQKMRNAALANISDIDGASP